MPPSSSLSPGVIAAALLISSCCLPRSVGPQPELLRPPPETASDEEREMAVLAFVSYTGEGIRGTKETVEPILSDCLQNELEVHQPLTRGRWRVAWGPAVYKFPVVAELDDNMMYVARSVADPQNLVIGIRGTNAEAILDWIFEDFDVGRTRPWPWTRGEHEPEPRISEGTHTGLVALQKMVPVDGLPGERQNLQEFLRSAVEGGVESVSVVGHSLGGALAPALGLWLEDTRHEWADHERPRVGVWGFAGATPGDAAFARYYDERLGQHSRRVHNPYDVVPHAWQASSLERLPGLYAPQIAASREIRDLTCAVVDLTRKHHYRQQLPQALPLAGHIFSKSAPGQKVDGYGGQAACQHTCGYYRGLGLVVDGRDPLIEPITSTCPGYNPGAAPETLTPRCEPCGDWG